MKKIFTLFFQPLALSPSHRRSLVTGKTTGTTSETIHQTLRKTIITGMITEEMVAIITMTEVITESSHPKGKETSRSPGSTGNMILKFKT